VKKRGRKRISIYIEKRIFNKKEGKYRRFVFKSSNHKRIAVNLNPVKS
jgi:hypothetical protein